MDVQTLILAASQIASGMVATEYSKGHQITDPKVAEIARQAVDVAKAIELAVERKP